MGIPGLRFAPSGLQVPTMTKRIVAESSAGAIIDVQDFFLAQLDEETRAKVETNLVNFARLLNYFRIPIIATLERPVAGKGSLPSVLQAELGDVKPLEKDFYDLTKEKKIRGYLTRLKKKQMIVAGCETDVCVLQSCLGLIDFGYEVIEAVGDSRHADAMIATFGPLPEDLPDQT